MGGEIIFGGYGLDNAITPWPALVRRLRILSGLKQADLAEQLGVDQCTVSRWERNLCIPDTSVQKRVRDMMYKLEPGIDRSFIENAPAIIAVSTIGNAGLAKCMSRLASGTFLRTPAEMRNIEVYGFATDSLNNILNELNGDAAWRNGEIASWRGVMRQINGVWVKFSAAPIGQSGLCMWICAFLTPPEAALKDDFQLTVYPFDELCD